MRREEGEEEQREEEGDENCYTLTKMFGSLSMLARLSRDYYPAIALAQPLPLLILLLRQHSDGAIRARVCNFVGNICR